MKDLTLLSGAAWDAQALNALKRDVAMDAAGNLKQVARQVEGVFVQMMLKSMRAALPKESLFNTNANELYTSLYDQQMAQQLSEKGLGLADMMVKQLAVTHDVPDEQADQVPMKLDNTFLQTYQLEKLEQMVNQALPKFVPVNHGAGPGDSGFMARLSIPTLFASLQSGIPRQLIMAQAALESGWGQREIPTAEGRTSYNLFGIKAGSNWDGPVSEVITTEYEQGVARKVKASFRVYGSYVEAINDYVKLLTQNPRYARVRAASSPEQAAYALQQAGYATDPHYAQKLINLINQIKNMGTQAVKAYTHDLKTLF